MIHRRCVVTDADYRGVVAVLAAPVPASPSSARLSYSIAGERTRAGQPLPAAFAVAAGVPEVVAVGSTAARQLRCRRPSRSPRR
jgi:S-methylmethionine-dependent homocysteine/selenocysteine methylase